MRLRVLLPTRIEVDQQVEKVVAEAVDGWFGLLPRHLDMINVLVPGLLSYHTGEGEQYLAIDGGLLAKVGDDVWVSTTNAVGGADLEDLWRVVEEASLRRDESEEAARAGLTRLETDLVQRLAKLDEEARV